MSASASQHDRHPLISVVIPVHNAACWLGETLASLYAQSEADFEIVLVDDASTDHLQDVLDRHSDARLQVSHLSANVGVSAARNYGIGLARGRYIAFCDADDICQPLRFALQLAFMEQHPDIGLCGGAFTCFDTQDRETVTHPLTDTHIRKALMQGNCFGLSTVMAKAEVLKVCCFDPSLRVAEDYDLWTRLVGSGVHAANLPQILTRYRLHPQQASRYKGAKLDQMSRQVRALYCACLLGDDAWVDKLRSRGVEPADLALAATKVAAHVTCLPGFSEQDFRFMLAWIYQQQPSHGPLSWWCWTRIQKTLTLALDRNYRLNTALLAFLPSSIGIKYFDTLIKLKR
jgi:glycosyltransferase involved in cell wall biosynthesis